MFANTHITYQEMRDLYGDEMAYDLLLAVERAAGVDGSVTYLDREERLEQAFIAMNETSVAA